MSALHPTGVFCAALTPFNADFSVDTARFVAHCHTLLSDGCDGIALLGTTGEANSLSLDERKALLEATLAAGIAPEKLMPGTGVAALPETVALTRHALANGVTTVVMLPPFYYKGVSSEGLVAAYSQVVEAVGDDRLKVVLYHIPQMSGVPIPHDVIEQLRARYPSVFVAIKDSSGDRANMEAMLERFPGLSVLIGADPLMLPLLAKGAAGCITATSNLVGGDLAFIFRHHADPARAAEVAAAQERVAKARNAASIHPQMASLKAVLAARPAGEGWSRLRPPLMPLSGEAEAEVRKAFSEISVP
ncbi:dihydrodipicolinate synthase family protein [Aquabacter sp. CN5-332]|uniref:dihydrodipicolinate synthase family protein n=1 Tax=Aquabacter sp. CN5-332 TaxID=3156608 RepID=UPI0032B4343A